MSQSWNTIASLGLVLGVLAASSLARPRGIYLEEEDGEISFNRLPKNIVPKHYDLEFKVPRMKKRLRDAEDVSGRVNITLKVLPISKTNKNPRRIILNKGDNVQVDRKSVMFYKSVEGSDIPVEISKIEFDYMKHLMEVHLDEELEPESVGRLEIKFRTYLSDNKHGLYKEENANGYEYFAIQFEAANAHQVFPCFDEPSFKASFNLSILHELDGLALSTTPVISKAPVDRHGSEMMKTIFAKTPPMSTHMLGFVVGPFEFIECPNVGTNKIPVRVYMARKSKDRAKHALDVATKSLEWMEKFTGLAYPLEKFDLVVVDNCIRESSENWGLAILREYVSLTDTSMSPDLPFQIALQVAHVVAHQWFGNLITTKWWDSLWITEMLASQKAFEIVRELYPEYKSKFLERHLSLYSAIERDSPQAHHVALSANPKELDRFLNKFFDQLFGDVTFMKSASLGQLFQNFVGAEKFDGASRDLLYWHKFANVDWSDFAESLGLGEDKKQEYLRLFSSQLYESSYPIINLDSDESQNKISIELTNVQANELKLSAIFGDISGQHEEVISGVNLDEREINLPEWFSLKDDHHYFKLNPEPDISTYFLVNYSPSLMESKLKKAIEEKHLSELDRLNVLDDAIELLRVEAIEASTLERLIEYYKYEDSLEVIMAIARASDTFSESLGTIRAKIKEVFESVFVKHGLVAVDNLADRYGQMAALEELINMQDKRVIEAALNKFDQEDPLKDFERLIHDLVYNYGDISQRRKLDERLENDAIWEIFHDPKTINHIYYANLAPKPSLIGEQDERRLITKGE